MLQTASVHWQLVAIDIRWIRCWRGWRGQRLAQQHSVTLLLQSRRFRIAHANGCCKQASACWSMTSSAIRPIWIVSSLVAKLGVSCAKWSFLQWEFEFHKSIIHTYSYFFHASKQCTFASVTIGHWNCTPPSANLPCYQISKNCNESLGTFNSKIVKLQNKELRNVQNSLIGGKDGGKVDPINFAILYPPIFLDSIPSFQFLDPASSSHRPRGSAFQDPGCNPWIDRHGPL